ncbi:MAG: enoyl-CoA hydratase/isomerase family protein [Pseudoxanthomonas sp.]|uniref:enoyl-CoA hydratase/isomerase family protein n=1 Tax=Hydrogenophaga sp. TaxID=1904254 RepID=UPI0027211A80|nr:enoyl-CoA hydratase/isomerase family protein [Hydrogenophaga sp.]MDO9504268.1 enoyl-CoA hydratase/isomerase family protein [Hydrogenophaga sp.]MDZ4047388.1 enoyl-CoA hydratase/isomerase family protein [Pseudoxanthomonas sp.]MDZ4283902.1 enoyl-CoA hydratase/isomerase family protein [Hydrogenophaga sp.]
MSETQVVIDDGAMDGGESVRTLTLNRPQKANALTQPMLVALAGGFAEEGPEVQVLRSASSRLFCAGADIAEFVASAAHLADHEHALIEMIRQRAFSPTPLVAIARGKASGAGALLLSLADVVIAADDLEFGCPEIRFGMYPVIVEAVLQSRVSPAMAMRLCLGQPLDAAEAHRVGLVTEVLPSQDFDVLAAQRLAFYLERSGALKVARSSRLRAVPPEQLMARVQALAPLMAENFGQTGVRERITAYLDELRRDKVRRIEVDSVRGAV